MTHDDIKTSLIKIEILWETLSKESSDDLDAFDFISTQSLSLQMTALELKMSIESKIRKDPKEKLKFQKLNKTLGNIVRTLDSIPLKRKDKKYIESILKKLSEIKGDIEVIRLYQ